MAFSSRSETSGPTASLPLLGPMSALGRAVVLAIPDEPFPEGLVGAVAGARSSGGARLEDSGGPGFDVLAGDLAHVPGQAAPLEKGGELRGGRVVNLDGLRAQVCGPEVAVEACDTRQDAAPGATSHRLSGDRVLDQTDVRN